MAQVGKVLGTIKNAVDYLDSLVECLEKLHENPSCDESRKKVISLCRNEDVLISVRYQVRDLVFNSFVFPIAKGCRIPLKKRLWLDKDDPLFVGQWVCVVAGNFEKHDGQQIRYRTVFKNGLILNFGIVQRIESDGVIMVYRGAISGNIYFDHAIQMSKLHPIPLCYVFYIATATGEKIRGHINRWRQHLKYKPESKEYSMAKTRFQNAT